MFAKRFLSSIVIVALVLLFVFKGGIFLLGFCGVMSFIALFEIYRAFKMEKKASAVIGYIALIGYYGLVLFKRERFTLVFIMIFLMALLTLLVLRYPRYDLSEIIHAFFGVFYCGVMLSCIYLTRELTGGYYLVWCIFFSSSICDTAAYCVGSLIGKHKMAPVLSPHKSVEGAVGGVVGTILVTTLYVYLIGDKLNLSSYVPVAVVVITAIGAFISMVGDLAASAIKRQYDIKDYGNIIPGHGGILDRFDSIIFTAPFIYCIMLMVIYH